MANKIQEPFLDSSCSDPAEDRDSESGIVTKHQDSDSDQSEPKMIAKCLGEDAEPLEMPAEPAVPCQVTKMKVKHEEEPKTETALVPPPVAVAAAVPVPPSNEGKGAKRMMEDDAEAFKEMPDVCQEAREPRRAMLLPDLFGEAQEAHSSLDLRRLKRPRKALPDVYLGLVSVHCVAQRSVGVRTNGVHRVKGERLITVQPDQHDILAQLGTVIGTETTQLLLRDPYLLILIVYMYVMHTQLYPDIFPTRKNNE
ncbi:hypothetical protein E2320_000556, partial [Naja naja]